MAKISSRSREVGDSIDACRPFDTYGALRGADYTSGSGILAGQDYEQWCSDVNDITYVVYSYATPIFWVTRSGRTHRVQQRFSVTTSRHMGQCPIGDNEKGK